MNQKQSGGDATKWIWRFSSPALAQRLKTDAWDWTCPASIDTAELIKENDQRQVWRIDLEGNSYYAKLYLRTGILSRIKRYIRGPACLKEWNVAHYALEHSIPCVTPLAYAVSTDPASAVDSLLITAGIPRALPLTDYWQNLRPLAALPEHRPGSIDLLEDALAELLARAHHAGLSHWDLHPGNLLVEPAGQARPRVGLVDLQAVRVGTPVSDRVAIYNLAQLNQWFRQNATLTQRMRLLKKYLACRQILCPSHAHRWSDRIFKTWARALDRAAQRHADALLASRDRRIMRSGKYFTKLRLPNHWRARVFLHTRHPAAYSAATFLKFTPDQWTRALGEPEKMLDDFSRHMRPIKNSRSTLVCRGNLQLDDHTLCIVAKRHVSQKPLAALWDCLRRSRSLRAWKLSFALLHRGLPVAMPLAVLERRIGPYLTNSILLTEEVKPAINLRLFITTLLPVIPFPQRRQIKLVLIRQLARLLRKMHRCGFAHRDLKATNILIQNPPAGENDRIDPDSLRIVLVDVDGLRYKKQTSRRDELRALVRLSLSADLSPHVTQTDRARFLIEYLTRYGSGIPDWKALWRSIQLAREKSFSDHIPG